MNFCLCTEDLSFQSGLMGHLKSSGKQKMTCKKSLVSGNFHNQPVMMTDVRFSLKPVIYDDTLTSTIILVDCISVKGL
jgi:hypothetical protein